MLAALPYDDIERYLRPALDKRRSSFRLVHQTSEPFTYVFEFHPDGEGTRRRREYGGRCPAVPADLS